MTTNKRVVLDAASKFRVEEVPLKSPSEGSLVVKITHAGICLTDVHISRNKNYHPQFVYQRVLGHEMCGTVHEFSPEAQKERPDLKVGDSVMIYSWGYCQNCDYCRGDWTSCCTTKAYGEGPVGSNTYGIWRDGGYQQYVTINNPNLLERVPENIPSREAAIMPCSGLTSYSAISKLRESVETAKRVKGSAIVGIVGAGGLGLWAIQITRVLYGEGVTIVAVDINEKSLKLAKDCGADIVYQWDKDDPAATAVEKLVAAIGGRFDGVVDNVGEQSLERSFLALHMGGTLVMVGMGGSMMPSMTLNSVLKRNVTIKGSMVGSQQQLRELIQLVSDGKVKPPPTEEVALDDLLPTMQKLLDGEQRGRAVIRM